MARLRLTPQIHHLNAAFLTRKDLPIGYLYFKRWSVYVINLKEKKSQDFHKVTMKIFFAVWEFQPFNHHASFSFFFSLYFFSSQAVKCNKELTEEFQMSTMERNSLAKMKETRWKTKKTEKKVTGKMFKYKVLWEKEYLNEHTFRRQNKIRGKKLNLYLNKKPNIQKRPRVE